MLGQLVMYFIFNNGTMINLKSRRL